MNPVDPTNDMHALEIALHKAQSMMQAASKDGANEHFNSKYATLAAVIEAVKIPFAENGLSYMQFMRDDGKDLFLVTKLMHVSGDFHESRMPLILSMFNMQGLGSAITYARRYSLSAIAGVAQEDDDGNAASNKTAKPPQQNQNQQNQQPKKQQQNWNPNAKPGPLPKPLDEIPAAKIQSLIDLALSVGVDGRKMQNLLLEKKFPPLRKLNDAQYGIVWTTLEDLVGAEHPPLPPKKEPPSPERKVPEWEAEMNAAPDPRMVK